MHTTAQKLLHQRVGKPHKYAANHSDHCTPAIPPWLGAMSTNELRVCRQHTTH